MQSISVMCCWFHHRPSIIVEDTGFYRIWDQLFCRYDPFVDLGRFMRRLEMPRELLFSCSNRPPARCQVPERNGSLLKQPTPSSPKTNYLAHKVPRLTTLCHFCVLQHLFYWILFYSSWLGDSRRLLATWGPLDRITFNSKQTCRPYLPRNTQT